MAAETLKFIERNVKSNSVRKNQVITIWIKRNTRLLQTDDNLSLVLVIFGYLLITNTFGWSFSNNQVSLYFQLKKIFLLIFCKANVFVFMLKMVHKTLKKMSFLTWTRFSQSGMIDLKQFDTSNKKKLVRRPCKVSLFDSCFVQ